MTNVVGSAVKNYIGALALHEPIVVHGDIWEYWHAGAWAVIPTNVKTRADGTAVMGAGLAKQAAVRFPSLPGRYGAALTAGTTRLAVTSARLLLVPTKHDWREPSTIEMVTDAVAAIAGWAARHPDDAVVVPALGAGLGALAWDDVLPVIQSGLVGVAAIVLQPTQPSR